MSYVENLLGQLASDIRYAEFLGRNLEPLSMTERNQFYTRKDRKLKATVSETPLTEAFEAMVEHKTFVDVGSDEMFAPLLCAVAYGAVLAKEGMSRDKWASNIGRIFDQIESYAEHFEVFQVLSWIVYSNIKNGYFSGDAFQTIFDNCNLKHGGPFKDALTHLQTEYKAHSLSEFAPCDRVILLDLSYSERLFVRSFHYFLCLVNRNGEPSKQKTLFDRILQFEPHDLQYILLLVVALYVSSEQKEQFVRKALRCTMVAKQKHVDSI